MPNFPITLITGTRKGIGKYLAEYYVSLGHSVIGCSREMPDWSLKNYLHIEADVSDELSVLGLFSIIREKYARLDNLINNAGVASMNHSLLTPLSTIKKVFNTNIIGTFLFCREAAKLMIKNNFGRIINFSTVATPLKLEGEAAYAASKAAVVSLTQILAKELASFKITVNSIGPTPIQTDLIKGVPAYKMAALLKQQAIPTYGQFEDVSNVIDFYLKEESHFITGQNIYLGGV